MITLVKLVLSWLRICLHAQKANMKNKSVKSMFFSPVTPKNIIEVVTNLKGNKSSGHDEIDSCVVKRCIHLITLPLSHIFNASFEHGTFPKDFKLAKVIPVL